MKKIYLFVIMMLFVGIASAAVYVTTNPEARLYFTRDSPGPDVSPIQCLFEFSDTHYSNSIGLGTMEGDLLEKRILFKNTDPVTKTGIVYFELECVEGLMQDTDGTIRDIVLFEYTDPVNVVHSGNTVDKIEWLSEYKVKITPTQNVYSFEFGVETLAKLSIEFLPYSYGDYTLTLYVDTEEVY